jgi:prepilin-type N-terminal cleavage/methylation domain-containing protein
MKQGLKKQSGFTILELIIVMIAVVILVAVIFYFYG